MDSRVVIENLSIADNFVNRLKGLLFKNELSSSSALLITPCNSVHTLFMKFAIDVVFLGKDYKVLKVCKNTDKNRFLFCLSASHTLEMNAGHADRSGIVVGSYLNVKECD